MVTATSAGLIGVVLLARHGDRSDVLFQNYTTYNSTQGYLTPYGSVRPMSDAVCCVLCSGSRRAKLMTWVTT